MKRRIITICYRKMIDASAMALWEKYVFEDTYKEFLMQAQYYNQQKQFTTFAQIINNNTNAEKLNFLVSSAAIGYIRQLNGKIPDVANSLGRQFLPFENFKFEIINSDVTDKNKHKVAINFYSDELIWHDTIGVQLLVSAAEEDGAEEVMTHMFAMQPFLSIYSLKETKEHAHSI